MLALGGGALAVGLLQAMDNLLSALYSFPGGYFSDRFGTKRSLFVFNLVALLLQQWMIEDDSPESLRSADSRSLTLEKNPLKLIRPMNPAMKRLLTTDILIRFCEQIPYAFVVVWCMKTIPEPLQSRHVRTLLFDPRCDCLVCRPRWRVFMANQPTDKPHYGICFRDHRYGGIRAVWPRHSNPKIRVKT
jgi:hypothetical protein